MIDKYHSMDDLLNNIAQLLISKKIMIATAESCTGGLIGHSLTNISGSSEFFERGIISYSNQAKIELLGVSEQALEKFGAVSEEIAKAMAEGVRKNASVDIGLATTGIAGPTGGSKEKPIGLVFIGLSSEHDTIVKQYNFKGDRLENKYSTLHQALHMLYQYISK